LSPYFPDTQLIRQSALFSVSPEQLVRTIETCDLNGVPAQGVDTQCGWFCRTQFPSLGPRTQSATIRPGTPYDAERFIKETLPAVTDIYASLDCDTMVRVVPPLMPGIEELLEASYFEFARESLTQFSSIASVTAKACVDVRLFERRPQTTVDSENKLNADRLLCEWIETFLEISDNWKVAPTYRAMLPRIISPQAYVVIEERGKAVACGTAILDQNGVGLYNISVKANRQAGGTGGNLEKSLGTKISSTLLAWGKANGANFAHLQVNASNVSARKLYNRLGFVDLYPYTHWRRSLYHEAARAAL